MTQKNESGKGVMVNQTGKPAAKGSNLQNKMAEMQRIAMAVHQLGEDLKTVDCGLEISIGDSQTAMLFSAMLGLEGEGETVTTEVAVAEDNMEETANTPSRLEDVAPEEEGPVELDRMTLLRVRMTALRETQKVIFLDEIDPKLFLKDCMAHGHLKRGVFQFPFLRFQAMVFDLLGDQVPARDFHLFIFGVNRAPALDPQADRKPRSEGKGMGA